MSHSHRAPRLRQFALSYAPDWIVTTVLWWILTSITDNTTGFKRQFSLTDPSLQHPYSAHQRVGSRVLWLLSGALPLCAQVVVNLTLLRSWWDLHHSVLGLWLSITLTESITQVVKVAVGRPRPDLISRCQPLPGSEDPPFGLSTIDVCTQASKHVLENGWRSFPSGHSSLAFAGLGFLTFYLAGKLRLFDTRGYAVKVWIVFFPLGIASWIAISRTMDYRHHWQDTLVGSALGLGIAYVSYRQYYPHLASKLAHIPFHTRFEVEEYNLDTGTVMFRDGDATDNEDEVALIGGRREARRTSEQQAQGS